jgi:predicted ATPase/class 3 adenylate cyclase
VGAPSGTVTFLFTDIEGSTRLWERDEVAMRSALERHDAILRSAIDGHGGYVFSRGGDGFAAAFGRAGDALSAAVESQRALAAERWPKGTEIRVRMGLHTGEVDERDGDYFGKPVNRTARLMAVGHGGQVLCSQTTAALVGAEPKLVDLGEHRLRDLSGATRVFQVRADWLTVEFPPLRTLDATPGNLPVQSTSFVGRELEVAELAGLMRAHRLVTLTGMGGVGKTRLAMQVAAEVLGEFPDGVWLVELAPVGDPAAVADAVATLLGINPQVGVTVAEAVAQALSGRRLLVVLDNCEHVLDAAGELVDAILARAGTVKVLATSREGLRVGAEQLWPVPSLAVGDGPGSPATLLFTERARAVKPGFEASEPSQAEAVDEVCRRLEGIPLAIELAAARMVSMSPVELRDHLGDPFRLLSGSRRGLGRHQTLRRAVGWSYDLLDSNERMVLMRCAVFAGGFDLAAAAAVCGDCGLDEYGLLAVLDSLVRKSLVTAEPTAVPTRYGMLETIRQFAGEQLVATGTLGEMRDRHAHYFADEAVAHWGIWDGPRQRVALDWVDVEFANLRTAFRWAAERGDVATAAAIAAHTTVMAFVLQVFEPAGWAEELLQAAPAAGLPQLLRLYTAASFCYFTGRAEAAVGYAQAALSLEGDPRYDRFDEGWIRLQEALAHLFVGRLDRALEIFVGLAAQPGLAHILGLSGLLFVLPAVGRAEEAMAIAEEAVTAARVHANPHLITFALYGYGQAFGQAEPGRALGALREGLAYAGEHRLLLWEPLLAREAAGLEAVHGGREEALSLFDAAIESLHRAGNIPNLAFTLASLAVFFDRIDRPEAAATTYGASTKQAGIDDVVNLHGALEHLRSVLGAAFGDCADTGAAMGLADAVRYARREIQLARPNPKA